MAEYFPTRSEAEEFIQEWYAKDGKPPVHFAKIFNNGAEKWIVNYDARQNPWASPAIKVLEDHSGEIRTIVAAPRSVKPPQPETLYHIGDAYRNGERQRQKELHERRQKVAPEALRRFALKKQSAFSVSFSPDSSLVAAGQYGYVTVWDVETGDVVTEIKASENAVHPLRFSPDGLVLAAGSYASYPYTGEVTLWSPSSGEHLGKVQNDSGDMGHVFGFSLDGNVLALGAQNRRVHLFEMGSGRKIITVTTTKYVANSIAFARPNLMLIAGVVPRQEHDSRVIPGIEIWESTTFKPIRTLEAIEGFYIVGGLAVSPDGSILAAGLSGNGGRVLLWDMKTFAGTTLAGYNGAVEAVGFSPDGKYLAAGCKDKRVRVWDLGRSEFKGQLQPLEEEVECVAFSPDGRFFAAGPAGSGHSTLWVWPSDTVVNLRATEIKDRAGTVLATVEGKGLDGADLRKKSLDGAVLTGISLRRVNAEGATFQHADFSGSDLTDADLTGASLLQTKFIKACLRNAKLEGVSLSFSDLSDADLRSAVLRQASFEGAKLERADLSQADLAGADLTGVNLSSANLSGAVLTGCFFDDGTVLPEGIDIHAHQAHSLTPGANLAGVDLRKIGLGQRDLTGADLSTARLTGSYAQGIKLAKADLTRAAADRVDFNGADFTGANLTEADLSKCNLARANFTGATLTGIRLAGSNQTGTIWPSGFNPNPPPTPSRGASAQSGLSRLDRGKREESVLKRLLRSLFGR